MEDAVKLVTRKLSGSSGRGGTDSESLQGWILKFGVDRKKLFVSVEMIVEWLANNSFALVRLLCIYAWPPDFSWQTACSSPGQSRVNLDIPFL